MPQKGFQRSCREECAAKAVIAVTGLDGALLAPPLPAPSEAWQDLEPYPPGSQQKIGGGSRQAAGAALIDAVPVFHATENYRAQRFKLQQLYRNLPSGLRVAAAGETPKGASQKKSIPER